MRVVICGSRGIGSVELIDKAVKMSGFEVTEVISGTASGPDTFAIEWAEKNGIPVVRMPADWNKYGRSAGFKRNKEMVDIADAVIAIWDEKSNGTRNTMGLGKDKGIPVKVFVPKKKP